MRILVFFPSIFLAAAGFFLLLMPGVYAIILLVSERGAALVRE